MPRRDVTADWSIELDDSFQGRAVDGTLQFVSAGPPMRTVWLAAWSPPMTESAEANIAWAKKTAASGAAPGQGEREFDEPGADSGEARYARWCKEAPDGQPRWALNAYTARRGDLVQGAFLSDSPEDLAWALTAWRSLRSRRAAVATGYGTEASAAPESPAQPAPAPAHVPELPAQPAPVPAGSGYVPDAPAFVPELPAQRAAAPYIPATPAAAYAPEISAYAPEPPAQPAPAYVPAASGSDPAAPAFESQLPAQPTAAPTYVPAPSTAANAVDISAHAPDSLAQPAPAPAYVSALAPGSAPEVAAYAPDSPAQPAPAPAYVSALAPGYAPEVAAYAPDSLAQPAPAPAYVSALAPGYAPEVAAHAPDSPAQPAPAYVPDASAGAGARWTSAPPIRESELLGRSGPASPAGAVSIGLGDFGATGLGDYGANGLGSSRAPGLSAHSIELSSSSVLIAGSSRRRHAADPVAPAAVARAAGVSAPAAPVRTTDWSAPTVVTVDGAPADAGALGSELDAWLREQQEQLGLTPLGASTISPSVTSNWAPEPGAAGHHAAGHHAAESGPDAPRAEDGPGDQPDGPDAAEFARAAQFAKLGQLDSALVPVHLNPALQATSSWPTARQEFRRIHRGQWTMIVSSGLSDAYAESSDTPASGRHGAAHRTGLGVEVFVESDDPALTGPIASIPANWAMHLAWQASQNIALHGLTMVDWLSEHRIGSIEFHDVAMAESMSQFIAHDSSGRPVVGALLGVDAPDLPATITVPDGPVRMLAVTVITARELDFVRQTGESGRQWLAGALVHAGTAHRSTLVRASLI
ncbi:MAG: hypothetical protein LBQ06_02840 [Frankiaceae bacterium]|nr:hypothetical protein [Frankiaceae bacterium]